MDSPFVDLEVVLNAIALLHMLDCALVRSGAMETDSLLMTSSETKYT